MDQQQQSNPYYYHQSNSYYHQQSYPHSNTYMENPSSHANPSQQQSQAQPQRFESQPADSTQTYQYSPLQVYPRQAYYPHPQETPTMLQSQTETSFSNPTQRAYSFVSHEAQPYPYSPPLQQEQYALRHVHSQPILQRNQSTAFTAYDQNPSSRTSHSSSDSSATCSDPMPSYRDDHYTQPPGAVPSSAGPSMDPYGSTTVPRLPPIFQVERHHITTPATQSASTNRRRNEASFHCPVPGCGSTFTRRFNLKGHLRSHTSERPFACEWPGCDKAFARQHDCKRHYQLHSTKAGTYLCQGCGKSFSRTDALNRHLRSEGGSECRPIHYRATGSQDDLRTSPQADSPSPSETTDGGATSETYFS